MRNGRFGFGTWHLGAINDTQSTIWVSKEARSFEKPNLTSNKSAILHNF